MSKKATTSKSVTYLGAAVHEGQSIKGVEKTPQILRDAGLFDSLKKKFNVDVNDVGDVSIQSLPKDIVQSKHVQHHVKNLHVLSPMLQKISEAVYTSVNTNPQNIMLTIGGDHSVGTGTISGLLRKYGNNLKVIWVDAHPDFIDIKNSDYYGYHGIPLAHLCGLSQFENFQWLKEKLPAQNVVLIGIRDIDHDEWKSLKQWKIKCFTMDHVDMFGIGQVMRQAIEYLDPKGDSSFHISFDIDAIDPHIANSTGTRFRGGLTHRQSCHIIRRVAHQRKLVVLDVVEINDEIQENKGQRVAFRGEQNLKTVSHTVGMGIDLIESIFTTYLEL